MASWEDVRQVALDLPGAVEDVGPRTTAWRVGSKAFAWERHLRRAEREDLGDLAPGGPALGVRVEDPLVREGLLLGRPEVVFSTAGYDAHSLLMVHVERATLDDLDEAITESWLCRAPQRLVKPFLAAAGDPGPG